MGPEFKWQNVSASRLSYYSAIVDWFATQADLRFRCIAVDREKVDLVRFHKADAELGFYKFYYQLLHHWILDYNDYSVFCDAKANRSRLRLPDLERCLNFSNLSSRVRVQAIRSEESVLIQLADVLTGAASSTLNRTLHVGSARSRVVERLENALGRRIAPTSRGEQKFNVFQINFDGGW